MKLRHKFQSGGTLLRTLTDEMQMLNDGAQSQAPGGQLDAWGRLRKSEFDVNPTAYVPGTLWLILDDDDGGKCIWGGRLDNEPEVDGVFVNLHANGPGKDPDDRYANRFWQSRDEGEWTAGDAEPHNYDQDRQIEAKVNGRRHVFRWRRKTLFIRNRGETRLDGAHSEGASTITVMLNAGGLSIGETVTVGSDRYTVRNTYSQGSTSIPVSPDLGKDYPDDTKVYWSANDGPGEWESGLVFWKEGKDIRSVPRLHLESDRLVPASLQLMRANGPNGALTLVKDMDLSSGVLERDEAALGIAGDPDQLYLRLRRTQESDDTGTDKGYNLQVRDIIVNGLAGDAIDYTADNVVRDIYGAYPGTLAVQNSDANAMPLDGEGASDGDILDQMCRLMPNRYWSRRYEDDASGIKNFCQPFGETEFILREKAKVSIKDMPRWNVVEVPYEGPGGHPKSVSVRADPDPFPADEFTLHIPLDDPRHGIGVAEALGRNAVDRVSQPRKRVEVECTEIINEDGNPVPATRLREGDVVILENYGNRRVEVHSLSHAPGGRLVTKFSNVSNNPGATGDPFLDRLIERRTLVLGRGRSHAHATLGMYDIDRPAVPESVDIRRKEVDVRGGRRRFAAIGVFDPVVRDVDGTGTSIRGYVGQFRFKDSGELVRDDDGRVIVKERRKRRTRNATTSDDAEPLRMVLDSIPKPRRYTTEFRVAAIDHAGEQSDFSAWVQLAPVGATTVPAPENLTVSAGLRVLEAEWDRDDLEETESDTGAPMFDRRVAHFRVERYKNGTAAGNKVGKTIKVKTTSKTWRIPKGSTVNGDTWYVKVWSVDHDGIVSAVAQDDAVVGETEDSQPTFTAVPNGIQLRVDPYRIVVDLTGSTNIWGSDGVRLHPGIDHFYIEVSTSSTFATILQKGRTKNPYATWKITQPSGSYYARAWVVDKADTKTGPTSTADILVQPVLPPDAPSVAFDNDSRTPAERINAVVTVTGGSSNEGINHYVVQAQVRNQANTAWKDLGRQTLVEPASGDADDTLKAVFKGIPRGRSFRARARAIDNLSAKSIWSSWTSAPATDSSAPPAPSNVEVFEDKKAVIVDWDAPTDPNDSEGADPEVKEYQVQIHTSTSFPAFASAPKRHKDRSVLGTKKRFNDVSLANTYYARVRSVSISGTKSGWVTSAGAVGPARVDLANETTGQVSNPQIADDSITTPKLVNDAVTSPKLDDSGNLDVLATFRSGATGERVEISTTSGRNVIKGYNSAGAWQGSLTYNFSSVYLTAAAGSEIYAATAIYLDGPDISVHSGISLRGYCGIQQAGGQVGAGETFGQGETWGGVNKTAGVPSSVTFTTVGTDSNVSSVAASDFNERGFMFKATSNVAGTFLSAKRTYTS